ncbi:ABC transporter substrate-binding protein [Tessaracoccus defluvii]|uniref:Extracellular solute-binding protein n=1 Tax=Tessaracoccus defluvii TaxID=1285901 RepID=A0A7H0H3Z8_9ACTN|nr:extracellular solute-binding protein [Tessaracoccus defluvii]QNP55264.1 extracellular solute-binding protein [Tessaracoccus defluvii]
MKFRTVPLALGALSLALAGCSAEPGGTPSSQPASSQSGSSPTEGAKSLSIVLAQYSPKTQDHWNEIIDEFKVDHPDVEVDLQVLDWGALTPTVNTLIQTQQYPDILNFGNWASYAAEGLLYPAEDVLSQTIMDDFLPAFAENSKLEGVQYAMPMVASVNVLYYNKDILDRAGITAPPATFEELIQQCSKIKELEEDIVPFAVALGAVGGTAEAALWTYSGGGDYFKDGEWVIDSDTNVETFEFIKQLTADGCTQPNPGQTNTGDGTYPCSSRARPPWPTALSVPAHSPRRHAKLASTSGRRPTRPRAAPPPDARDPGQPARLQEGRQPAADRRPPDPLLRGGALRQRRQDRGRLPDHQVGTRYHDQRS